MSATRFFTGLHAIRRPPRHAVVTIGVFDGVHLAHQQLIRSVMRRAHRARGTSVVITFDPDPQIVLAPRTAHPMLMPFPVRLRHLRALGVDWIWVIPFTKHFARMTARQFIQRVLISRLCTRTLVVGETFAFGRQQRGDMDLLRTLGPSHGMTVIALRPITRQGAPISSSRIRRLIAKGHVARARQLLGRPPALYGQVVRGAGRGLQLGFPTANLRITSDVLPPPGVYAVRVSVDHQPRSWRGVMNLGTRPTFGPGALVCEVHLLGFSGILQRRSLELSLLGRLRGERWFASPQALVRQIRRDLVNARRYF